MYDIDRQNKILKKIMWENPYYFNILASVNKIFSESVPTAGVGIDSNLNVTLLLNPTFLSDKSEIQIEYIFVHEMAHLTFEHLTMSSLMPVHSVAQVATDIYIFAFLETIYKGKKEKYYPFEGDYLSFEDWSKSPKKLSRAIHPEDYGYTCEEVLEKGSIAIYNELLNKEIENLKIIIQMFNNGELDYLKHEWPELSKNDEIVLENNVDNLVLSSGKGLDLSPQLRKRFEAIIKKRTYKIPWNKLFEKSLRNYSDSTKVKGTYYKENRYSPDLPKLIFNQFNLKSIYIIVDTSGSITSNTLLRIFSIVVDIKKKLKCNIIIVECDNKINEKEGIYEFKDVQQIEQKIQNGLITGGGGTNVTPAIEYINSKKNSSEVVYITDGQLNPPEVYPKGKFIVVLDEKTRVTKEEIEKKWKLKTVIKVENE